jgi:hypothetical protein
MKRTPSLAKVALAVVPLAVAALVVPFAMGSATTMLSSAFDRPADVSREPVAQSPEVVLSRGTRSGIAWQLSTYESDRGTCLHLVFSGPASGAAGGCGFDMSRDASGFSQVTFPPQGAGFVIGLTTSAAHSVRLSFSDGRRITQPTMPNPSGSVSAPRFFVAATSADSNLAAYEALSQSGAVIDRRSAVE